MSVKKIHINDSKPKEYIVPTNEWLKPIEPLITNDVNSRSLIMLSHLVDQGKVVVKITKNSDYKRIKTINENIKNNPNMLHTFGTIKCSESEINYDVQYKDCNGYCNKHESETENIEVVLEIMKLYDGSLNQFPNNLNLQEIKKMLKQMIFCQLHIYNKIGFVHNDIHLGNILYKLIPDSKKPETFIYTIDNISYKIKTHTRLILSDFDRAKIYDQNILPLDYYDYKHTINENIVKTVNQFKLLLNKTDQQILSQALEESSKVFSAGYIYLGEKSLRSYYRKHIDLSYLINQTLSETFVMLNKLWMIIYNQYLFPRYGL